MRKMKWMRRMEKDGGNEEDEEDEGLADWPTGWLVKERQGRIWATKSDGFVITHQHVSISTEISKVTRSCQTNQKSGTPQMRIFNVVLVEEHR